MTTAGPSRQSPISGPRLRRPALLTDTTEERCTMRRVDAPGMAPDTDVHEAAKGLRAHTAAVLVAYHLDPAAMTGLARLHQCLGELIVVDNREIGECPLDSTVDADAAGIVLRQGNRGALAGAYNAALAWLQQHRPDIRYVLFLDEDSQPDGIARFLDDPLTAQVVQDPRNAAVSAAYRDRSTGLRGRYLRLTRWQVRYLPREFQQVREVAFLINSMSLWRLDALQRIGRYDESLALDHIDTDACLRARRQGLRLHVNGRQEFLHAIGHRRKFRLFGLEMQAGGHSPERRRMMARNTLRLALRECRREPAFVLLCMSRLAYEAVGILRVEDRKRAKLGALLAGMWDAIRPERHA